ncbi:MFS transporter [Ralstonia pickettii]|uniref:MFS transporter n=1 Tax=Ralstonia pickettii TaxID=329 RepID=UPI002D768662|nr:MFS transporter [Ralstonia pickettii]
MAQQQSLTEYYKNDVFAFLLGFGGSVWGGLTYYLGIPVALLSFLGASSTQIGLITTIFWAGFAFPQIWAGYKSEPLIIKKKYIAMSLFLSSLGFLVYGLYLFMSGNPSGPFAIWFFFAAFAWACFLGGLYIPGNFSLLFKVIPSAKMGQLLGIYFAVQFGGIFLSGFAIKAIGNSFAQPMNYAVLFLITFLFTLFAIVIMLMVKEPEGEKVKAEASLGAYIGKLITVYTTDKLFVKFLVAKWLMTGHYIMMAFLLAFLLKDRGMDPADAGWFTALNGLGLFIGGFTIARIADIWGPKYLLITSQIIAAAYTLMVLLIPTASPVIIFAAFLITGLAQISDNVGYTNMTLFCCPTHDKSTYVAAVNVGIIPFMVFLPPIIGKLIDNGALTYLGAFGLALGMMIASILYIAIVLVNPPAFTQMKAAQKA